MADEVFIPEDEEELAAWLAWLETEEDPALQAVLEELESPWFSEMVMFTGAGFRENVLRGSEVERDGWFHWIGGEGFWIHEGTAGRRLTLFLAGEAQRYPDLDEAPDEINAFAYSRWDVPFSERTEGWLGATLVYSQQPFDLSRDELEVFVETVSQRSVRGEMGVRRSFADHHRVAMRVLGNRVFHRLSVEDYSEGSLRGGWRREPTGGPWVVEGSLEGSWRWFDHRPIRAEDGTALPDTSLRFQQLQAVLDSQWRLPADPRWRLRARLSHAWRWDNGEGYFDYTRWLTTLGPEFVGERIRVRVNAGRTGYRYDNQTVSPGEEEPYRWSDWHMELQCDWKITPRATLRWQSGWETLQSRRPQESYRSRYISLAFRWEI